MWVLLVLLLLPSSYSFNKGILKFVNVLYRHGDRTPVNFYPNDPYKNLSNWPTGPGQLTPRGMKMQYELGQYLRKRYDGFLNATYSKEDIFIRSTDFDRTLMSALSNLAGLYPPEGSQIWNPNLLWQPIPVHTVPGIHDIILGSQFECPKFKLLRNITINKDPYFKALNEKYKLLYSYVTKHSGQLIDNIEYITYIHDTLFIEELYNKSLPEWTKKVYPEPLNKLSAISFVAETWTKELKRLKSGLFIARLLHNFEKAMDSTSPDFIMYSAHDNTVSGLLNSLGIFDIQIPPYASCVIMELHQSPNGSMLLRFQYRNDTTKPPYDLILPGCTLFCPLESFKELTSPIRLSVEEWKAECQIDSTINVVRIVSVFVAILFLMIMIISVTYVIHRKLRHNDSGYVSIVQEPH
ncbi:prostatic acid phosphatase [Lepeophtheirus salmonis]|uniref:prostatic acid phosphatase n=1 Tax=Lepeophtheirus salmonis TaxID=72036 RepID=UPI001AE57E2E|nr:prostatic acid phosphatase-like [Lepeophtheirus salmonis]